MEIFNQEELEKKVIEMLLTSNHPVAKILRNQYENSEVVSREYSGVGFFTAFKIKSEVDITPKKDFAIRGVHAYLEGQKGVLDFILYVRNGFIIQLEGYTIGIKRWPDNHKGLRLKFEKPEGITDYSVIFGSQEY
jgi:hypothetical protein